MVIECVGRCPTPRQGEVLPAPPARLRRANKHNEMTSTPQQEIQEMQEMQERPVGATEGTRGCGAEPRQEHQSANQRISQSARRSMERPEIQERPASGRRMKTLEDRQGAKRRAVTPLTHSGLPVALARVLFSVFCFLFSGRLCRPTHLSTISTEL